MIVADLDKIFVVGCSISWGKKLSLIVARNCSPGASDGEAQEIESIFNPDVPWIFVVEASSTLATYLIPLLIIPGFLINHPGTNIRLISSNKKNVIDQLEQFGLDIEYLLPVVVFNPDIEKHYLFDDRLTIFCAKDHPLAKKSNISDSDLKKHNGFYVSPAHG